MDIWPTVNETYKLYLTRQLLSTLNHKTVEWFWLNRLEWLEENIKDNTVQAPAMGSNIFQ